MQGRPARLVEPSDKLPTGISLNSTSRVAPESSRLPLVSVIVTAGTRTRFLKDALQSVANQDCDLHDCELVVVSTEPHLVQAIVSLLPRLKSLHRTATVVPTGQAIGPVFASGIRSSTGRVLAFLNDDDMWLPSKLSVILAMFLNNKDLGYVKHSQSFVDEYGKPEPDRSRLGRIGQSSPGTELHLSGSTVQRELRKLARFRPDFNSSSIALRRNVVDQRLLTLERMARNEDTFFFYSAIAARCAISVIPEKLTLYRVHEGSTSAPQASDLNHRLRAYSDFNQRLAASSQVALQDFDPKVNQVLIRVIKREIAMQWTLTQILSPKKSRLNVLHSAAKLIRFIFTYDISLNVSVELLATLYLLSPSLAWRTYLAHRDGYAMGTSVASPGSPPS